MVILTLWEHYITDLALLNSIKSLGLVHDHIWVFIWKTTLWEHFITDLALLNSIKSFGLVHDHIWVFIWQKCKWSWCLWIWYQNMFNSLREKLKIKHPSLPDWGMGWETNFALIYFLVYLKQFEPSFFDGWMIKHW